MNNQVVRLPAVCARQTSRGGAHARFMVDLDVGGRIRQAVARELSMPWQEPADDMPLDPLLPGGERFAALFIRLQEEFSVRVSGADVMQVATVGELIALFDRALGRPGADQVACTSLSTVKDEAGSGTP